MIDEMDDELYLAHEGVSIKDGAPGRGSGRYALGSGDNPYQHGSGGFIGRYDLMKAQGMSESEIAKAFGFIRRDGQAATSKFKAALANAKNERDQELYLQAKKMQEAGMGWTEIGRAMGKSESTIRGWFKEDHIARLQTANATADVLRERVDKVGMIDVGSGTELYLGVTRTRMDQALQILENEGYNIYGGRIEQVTNPGKMTTMKVLCPPGTQSKEIFNPENLNSIKDFDVVSHDGGDTFVPKHVYPASLDSKRLEICYAEDGGKDKDGIVEIRRGVKDLSLGESQHYSQVRILVDGTHYIKGMAVYADDLPPGVDLRFNTNKTKDVAKMDVLKKIHTEDPNNPFGSNIKLGISKDNFDSGGGQSYYIGDDGKEHLSLINKRSDEGDWEDWSKTLPSQFLAKQTRPLIKQQLEISRDNKMAEFEDIKSVNNPVVKKVLLDSFAKDCDKSAETLKAASLPRQRYQVILPEPTLKETECYAPNFKNGEVVALVRFPHGGLFEIPILTVNNKNENCKRIISPNAKDAVGINAKVAERLSGADFDGDTVLVIPTSTASVKNKPPLQQLRDFDPKTEYKSREGMTKMKYYKPAVDRYGKQYMKVIDNTQREMGIISNLITDMTLQGAPDDELARAVKHSMVVIDAAKHELDYKRSEKENNIKALKEKYQAHIVEDEDGNIKTRYGAGTLISRAKSEATVAKRQGDPVISRETGEISWKTTTNLYYTDPKTGKQKKRTQASTQMAETKDAYTLSSGTPKEALYADYANTMKQMANDARKLMVNTETPRAVASAKETYAKEVASLESKLHQSLQNAPRERQAQYIASSRVRTLIADNPGIEDNKKEIKKYKQRYLQDAREAVGAKRTPVVIEDKEWEAIQMGAVSSTKLQQILNHTDLDKIKERSMPRNNYGLTASQTSRIATLTSRGFTNSEIADMLGVSVSTVQKYNSK